MRYDKDGNFVLEDFSKYKFLYYPLCNHSGLKSSITPKFNGDSKLDQNHFLLPPSSTVDLLNNANARNLWFTVDSVPYSITGESLEQKINRDTEEVTFGYLFQKVLRTNKKFSITVTSFVPEGKNIELHKVIFKNLSKNVLNVSPFLAIPLYGRSASNIRDHRHVTSLLNRVDLGKNTISLKPTLSFDERGHNKNTTVYSVITSDIRGKGPLDYYTDLESYLGTGSFLMPGSVYNSEKNNQYLSGHEVIAGFKYSNYLVEEGDSLELTFGIGASNDTFPLSILECFDELFLESKKVWSSYDNNLRFNTKFSHILKTVTIQPVLRRIYGCSFLPYHDYGKGGRGWRDLWQDSLALIIMDNLSVRSLLINNFKGVRLDGSNATIIGDNPGEFIADRNGIPRVWIDHGAWPLITVELYAKYNNDYNIFNEEVTYFRDKFISLSTKTTSVNVEADSLQRASNNIYTGSVLEHLLLENMIMYYNVGSHNFMRLMGADWNDAMDMAEEEGESVAFSSLYAKNYETLLDVLDNLGLSHVDVLSEFYKLINKEVPADKETKQKSLSEYFLSIEGNISGEKSSISVVKLKNILKTMYENIKEEINKTEWLELDGYYNGYYDNSKRQLEGNSQMILTSQVFPILSGIASNAQIEQIIEKADLLLYDKSIGGYKLNTNFNELKDNMGRLFGFSYGTKENGSVFSHMAVMYAYALYSRGYVNAGYKVIKALLDQISDFESSETLPGLPEYFDASGKGLYGYLTGSASWLILTLTKEVFGVYLDREEVIVSPKISRDLFINGHSSLRLLLGNKHVNITYINEDSLEYNEYKIGSIFLDDVKTKKLEFSKIKEDSVISIFLIKK